MPKEVQYPVTVFHPPDGRRNTVLVAMHARDAEFFRRHNAAISAEVLRTNERAYYADVGIRIEGDTPIEAIHVCPFRTAPIEALRELRLAAERLLENQRNATPEGQWSPEHDT